MWIHKLNIDINEHLLNIKEFKNILQKISSLKDMIEPRIFLSFWDGWYYYRDIIIHDIISLIQFRIYKLCCKTKKVFDAQFEGLENVYKFTQNYKNSTKI